MTTGLGFSDKKAIAEQTAKMFIEVEAVRFMADKPFIFTSGWASPVYTDCRRLISFPQVRRSLIEFAAATLERVVGADAFDAVAGGVEANRVVLARHPGEPLRRLDDVDVGVDVDVLELASQDHRRVLVERDAAGRDF